MPKVPVFRGDPKVPLWIDFESGDHLPAWAEDPCDCCPGPSEWNPTPKFEFCGCQTGGVQLSLSGFTARNYWQGGFGPEYTEFANAPSVLCGNGTGMPSSYYVFVGGMRGDVRGYIECHQDSLNGSYQTTDIYGNHSYLQAAIHLGEYHSPSGANRGVRVCYKSEEDYADCPTLQDGVPPEKLYSVLEGWTYVYLITIEVVCTPCVGGSYLSYDWRAYTQEYRRLTRNFPPGARCQEEGWVLPARCTSSFVYPWCELAAMSGSGEGVCVSLPACPRVASGSYDATSCDGATTINHDIELH